MAQVIGSPKLAFEKIDVQIKWFSALLSATLDLMTDSLLKCLI